MASNAPPVPDELEKDSRPRLRVAVRDLATHVHRAGDLDLESFGRSSPVDAIRAHQKIQGSRGEAYRSEVTVGVVLEDDALVLDVSGRIDGVLEGESGVVVEEIKTTRGELDAVVERSEPTHWAQLKLYAYLYGREHELDDLRIRLTYYQLDDETSRSVETAATLGELEQFFEDTVERYLAWAKRVASWRRLRDDSILETSFPFPAYREGQRAMAVQVYRAIEESGQLLVRAPTGIGKTLATLFPSLKSVGAGGAGRVVYLTARTTGRALAESALGELAKSGLRAKSVTLTAKESICFNPDRACNGEECDFARGFYDRIDGAVSELFSEDDFTRKRIERVARRHRVCPFELSLELALAADIVICDYNYVFDPRVRLRRLFADGSSADILLVDEAHHLLDRARDMYSAEVRLQDVVRARKAVDGRRHRALARSLSALREELEAEKAARGEAEAVETAPSDALEGRLRTVVREAEGFLVESDRGHPAREDVRDLFFTAFRFLSVLEAYDERYVTCYELRGRDLRVRLFCTDPSPGIAETLESPRATILFSATLTPLDFHRRTLGCRPDAKAYALPSPFPPEHLAVLVADRIATRFTERAKTLEPLTSLLATFVTHRPGNYLVFFPSYDYLESAEAALREKAPGIGVLIQRPGMSEPERTGFLERFDARDGAGRVGLAVLGGFFGEGIDLTGDRLEGVAVVGVGLPGLGPERDRMRQRYEHDFGAGFDYAYVYPGFNRVLQAAGRLIRSENDRGVVLLVDERFAEARYRRQMPSEWTPRSIRSDAELERELEAFWSRRVPETR